MSTMLNFVPMTMMTITMTIQMIYMNMIGWKDKSCTSSNSAFISSATVDWDCLGSYQIEKDKENDEACTRCCRAIEITKASLLPTITAIAVDVIVIAAAYASCSSGNIMNTR